MEQTPGIFTRFLTRQSEGLPFFVAEYLKVAIEEGILHRDERGEWHIGEGGDENPMEPSLSSDDGETATTGPKIDE